MSVLDIFRSRHKSSDFKTRMQAVKEITDQAILEEIALHDSHYKVRKMAVHKLKDQDILKEIARNDSRSAVRAAAVSRITDQPFLVGIARDDPEPKVALSAIKKIKDSSALYEIVKKGKSINVQIQVLSKISDIEILSDIVKTTEDKRLKKAADKRLSQFRPKYNMLKIEIKCPECSQPFFINGPFRQLKCNFCTSAIDLDKKFWRGILKDSFSGGYTVLGYSFGFKGLDFLAGERMPRCTDCGKKLQCNDVPTGSQGTVTCQFCNFENTTFPAPEWMRKMSNKNRYPEQIFCAEQEGDEEKIQSKGVKPIVTSCLQCGGNLQITADTPRNVTCSYCNTTQYLPDPLWFALHPIKTKRAWYIRWSVPQI
jgi:hypothetical protein